jgi:uncharacterized protein (TIGR00645 family)
MDRFYRQAAQPAAVLDLSAHIKAKQPYTRLTQPAGNPRRYWGKIAAPHHTHPSAMNKIIKPMEFFIFWSRWLQAPLYLGLIVAQGVYVYQFMHELALLVTKAGSLSENEVMLIVLGLIDVVMIANLLIMVIIGGYETFVSRLDLEGHPDQPEWLSHVNAGVLKVKLAVALISISSIHLLRTFINAANRRPRHHRPDRDPRLLPGLRHRHRLHRQDHDADPADRESTDKPQRSRSP